MLLVEPPNIHPIHRVLGLFPSWRATVRLGLVGIAEIGDLGTDGANWVIPPSSHLAVSETVILSLAWRLPDG